LHDPQVLILDEPTIGLDPNQIREVRALIKSLAGAHTLMLSTHILPEAQMTCERVIIINQGKVVATDTTSALTHRVKDAEVMMFRVAKDDGAIPSAIRSLENVHGIKPVRGDKGAYQVETSVGCDCRPEVAKAIVEGGWGLLELRPLEMSLEEVFVELTAEDEEGH
jgi:ABC-2 type transport system ATP-binding protein